MIRQKFANFLALFTSFTTLICCALPAFLVVLGLGGVVVAGISNFPFLITLSKNKEWVFAITGLVLALDLYLVYRPRQLACDPNTGNICQEVSAWSKIILWISVIIFAVGFFMAYLAVPIFKFMGIVGKTGIKEGETL